MKTYHIESLGCAKNLVDSEVFAGLLESGGWEDNGVPEGADIVLLNTCGFLQSALAEVDQVLSELADLKNRGLIGKLYVTGCMLSRALDDFQPLFPEVDAWIGLKDFPALARLVNAKSSNTASRSRREAGTHAYLRISDGCDNRCSYCAIPSIRGGLRSVPMEDILAEARALADDTDNPVSELVVIAQDTCSYGVDIYGRQALPELISKLLEIKDFAWIRVMYMHPDHFNTDWLKLWQDNPRLLPYFEIPVQHSEAHILKAMGRRKHRQQLLELFDTIKRQLPDAVLRTTLICGFPGETRQEAIQLQSFMRQVGFMHLGAFEYSPEPGTPAYEFAEAVPSRTASRRRDKVLSMHRALSEEYLAKYVGQRIAVVVEEAVDSAEGFDAVGRAWFQAPDIDGRVFISGHNLAEGDICLVEIEDIIDLDLHGNAVQIEET